MSSSENSPEFWKANIEKVYDRMVLAGWITSYAYDEARISVQWTDEGKEAIRQFSALLQELIRDTAMDGNELTALFAILDQTRLDG